MEKVLSDVLHYKTLEAAIFQRKRALDYVREGIAISDPSLPDNPIVYVNKAFLDLTGYSEQDILLKNCRFLQGPDTDAQSTQSIRDAIAQQQTITVELLNYRKDGTEFWNHLTISPVFNDHGELVNFVAVQRDVTELRYMQQKLHNQERHIETLQKAVSVLQERVEFQEKAIESYKKTS